MMANAQQPMRRTRHMDIKKFALLDWVEQDLMIMQSIKTAENAADAMTKPLAKQLFYCHADTIMGRRVPQYVLLLTGKKGTFCTLWIFFSHVLRKKVPKSTFSNNCG
jgi:hypothetical protein